MAKHIPGNPNLVIRNIPGGSKALNLLAGKTKPDGMTIQWGPLQLANFVAKAPGVRFDPTKFEIIGTGQSSFVTIVRTDTKPGVKQAVDIVKADRFAYGGIGPGRLLDMLGRLAFNSLDVKYNYITGYRNQPKMNQAIRSKEISGLTTGHPGYHAFYKDTILKDGTAVATFYHSPFDVTTGDPIRLPGRYPAEIKHFLDFYKDARGKDPSGPVWEAYKWLATFETWPYWMTAPAGTPAEAVAALRKAHKATTTDPEFIAAWKKQFRDVPVFAFGEDARKTVLGYTKISPAAMGFLKEVLVPKKK
jgi:tripartite-type tricarboxylate transporter receptor subunit TctC